MIPRNQVLTSQQIVANKPYLKKLHIDPKKTITSQDIETAFNQQIKLQQTDKPSDSKTEEAIKSLNEARDKLLIAIKYTTPEEQKVGELEQAKTLTLEQLEQLQKKLVETKQTLANTDKNRAEIEKQIESCDSNLKDTHVKLETAHIHPKIEIFKVKYSELFKLKKLSSRLRSENFLKGKENLSPSEFKKQIEAKIENKPIGTVADAWDATQKATIIPSDEIISLKSTTQVLQQKLADEKKQLTVCDDNIVAIKKQLSTLEESVSKTTKEIAELDGKLAQCREEKLTQSPQQVVIAPEEKKTEEKKTEIQVKKPEVEVKKEEIPVKKEEIPLEQVLSAFKKIYRALRAGQTGWMKYNFMTDKDSLEPKLLRDQIESYVKDNPGSREEVAWKLAHKHYHNCTKSNLALFSEIYQWSFENSSLIKVSQISGTSFFSSSALQKTQPEFTAAEVKQNAEKPYTRTAKICNALS